MAVRGLGVGGHQLTLKGRMETAELAVHLLLKRSLRPFVLLVPEGNGVAHGHGEGDRLVYLALKLLVAPGRLRDGAEFRLKKGPDRPDKLKHLSGWRCDPRRQYR